ncbi:MULTISPECIES: 4-hydroxy-tetrahydrodipicolinate reductase [Caloramator]|uniref:4-hydroxy-tetrahydrodipicolinate reductase n=1 Tax=Caloramator australicus RC3 TaxID=857293 RepID=G0V4T6_9CLOT|nr:MULTISPECIES: 4-hydroxy-tetrahydrodipicolinate reductase [Caloramator]MDO6355077.1 4-hydroxy-tetrahydrodipicolinate reductase [Caloramator sp. CAR-1]CCC58126.1 Dihydrodipicolinate reductase [Caloramator australicus RC3]
MKVLLHGCNGKMGQVLTRIISQMEDMKIICGVDREPNKIKNPYPVYDCLSKVQEDVDVLIDFSNHSALDSILEFGLSKNVPLVICTTGFSPEEKEKMKKASEKIPILNSANMSIGINLITNLLKNIAPILYGDFDIEIIEKHHNQKLDSPSGTALMLADAINSSLQNSLEYVYGRHSKTDKRKKEELGIHAIRGGAIVGEHSVIFAGAGEVIEINHSALSRDVFAYGAIRAAKFLVGKKPNFYTMNDVLK